MKMDLIKSAGMKSAIFRFFIFFTFFPTAATLNLFADPVSSPRERLLMDFGWKFHLGNEWAIAGWLPLFLSQRLGMSPQTAILILALYWLALLIGRVAAQWILSHMRHGRMLTFSVLI